MLRWKIIISICPADRQWTTREVPVEIALIVITNKVGLSITKILKKIGKIFIKKAIEKYTKMQSK
jgi:hypothetical protein